MAIHARSREDFYFLLVVELALIADMNLNLVKIAMMETRMIMMDVVPLANSRMGLIVLIIGLEIGLFVLRLLLVVMALSITINSVMMGI